MLKRVRLPGQSPVHRVECANGAAIRSRRGKQDTHRTCLEAGRNRQLMTRTAARWLWLLAFARKE